MSSANGRKRSDPEWQEIFSASVSVLAGNKNFSSKDCDSGSKRYGLHHNTGHEALPP
jgi:hypothetical protein